MFEFYSKYDYQYEITLLVRDHEGNPTGQKKTFATDDPYKLWVFFNRFQGRPKRKKKRKKKTNELSNQTIAKE